MTPTMSCYHTLQQLAMTYTHTVHNQCHGAIPPPQPRPPTKKGTQHPGTHLMECPALLSLPSPPSRGLPW